RIYNRLSDNIEYAKLYVHLLSRLPIHVRYHHDRGKGAPALNNRECHRNAGNRTAQDILEGDYERERERCAHDARLSVSRHYEKLESTPTPWQDDRFHALPASRDHQIDRRL